MDNTIVQIWLNVKYPHCLFWQSLHSHLEDSVDMLRYDSILSIRCVTKQRKRDKCLSPPKTDVGMKGGKSQSVEAEIFAKALFPAWGDKHAEGVQDYSLWACP